MTPPVIRSAWVPCDAATAFEAFTEEIGAWWPLPTHGVFGHRSGGVSFDRGRLVERSLDGEEVTWAEVTTWSPPTTFSLDWHPGRGADEATTVEVTFAASGNGTQVVIEHSGWERLGDDAAARRQPYIGPNAWGAVLDHYADSTEASPSTVEGLRDAQQRFAEAAAAALAAPTEPEPGERDVRRIIAHVAITDIAMLQVCQALVHDNPTRFDNAPTQSTEVLDRWLSAADDDAHLLERSAAASRQLAAALARLSTDQLVREVDCLLVHDGEVMVDEQRRWGQLAIDIQSEHHVPAHIDQLTDLTDAG